MPPDDTRTMIREKAFSPLETEMTDETVHLEITDSSIIASNSDGASLDIRRATGTLQLAVIVFYTVSGGPFGIEEAVRSAGPFICLLGFLIGPLIWSIPEAAMTAELGSAYPDASGGVAWVEEAFGPRAGWTCGFLGVISGATDSAIYPVLFLDYVLQVVNIGQPHPLLHYLACSIFAMILAYINYRGLNVVGNLTTAICIFSMSPFIVATILGITKVEPHRWFRLPDGTADEFEEAGLGLMSRLSTFSGVLWRPFLNSLFWNLNSFDSAASFSTEVEDPGRSFPRAMLLSVILVASCYFLPLLVVLGVSDAPQSAWVDGYMATAISQVDGVWLERWLVIAAGITNVALFQAELAADAFQVMGMAERGYLPSFFAIRSNYGTPTYGILLGLLIVLLMSVTKLESIIELLNFNYAISLLMEYSALLKLRVSKPEVHRPFRIPLGTYGLFVMMMPTFFFTLLIMGLASFYTIAFGIASVIISLGIFQLQQTECVVHMYRKVVSYFNGAELLPSEPETAENIAPDAAEDSEVSPEYFDKRGNHPHLV